jgi:uncharacterized protein YbbK (DUF523 family)/uncharacterized protein YbgA (DUF1722 family)
MNSDVRPRVVISKCLGFAECRYNGAVIPNTLVKKLSKYVETIQVCPEVEIGLGIPRDPVRIVRGPHGDRLMQPATGKDVTKKMEDFTKDFLYNLPQVDGFILKHESPSCGKANVKIYREGINKAPLRGEGFFGREVMGKYPSLAIEDEGRLRNFTIREHFLTKLWILARFREVEKNIRALIEYHSQHKLLFAAFNQVINRSMGRILANHSQQDINKIYDLYHEQLNALLIHVPTFRKWINTLMHAFGGLSPGLTKEEKQFFLNKVEEYRDERIPRSILTGILESWTIRFQNDYLLSQKFINPFPKELVDISDSGKGRDS